MINLNGVSWQINRPTLFRYEDEMYIDKFFNEGIIRLSSFKSYRKYEDDALGDRDEGKTLYLQHGSVGLYRQNDGLNAYCFCTSLANNAHLKTDFKRNSCFKIINPTEFGIAISRCMEDFIGGLEGYCIYVSRKMVSKYPFPFNTAHELAEFTRTNPKDFISLINNIGANNPNNYFYKLLKYSPQQEYRILFFTKKIVQEYLDLKCPEAIQYCRRLDSIEESYY